MKRPTAPAHALAAAERVMAMVNVVLWPAVIGNFHTPPAEPDTSFGELKSVTNPASDAVHVMGGFSTLALHWHDPKIIRNPVVGAVKVPLVAVRLVPSVTEPSV